jgi:hypothetical protein
MSHMKVTKGSVYGHIFRRCIHLSCLLLISFGYFHFYPVFASYHRYLILAVALSLAAFEYCRIKCGWLFLGMRDFEVNQVCSAAWSVFGLAFLFFFAPNAGYVFPIAFLSALIDPLSGELKGKLNLWLLIALLYGVALLIWYIVAHVFFAWPVWYGVVVCAVAIAMDFLPWRSLDDNVTMLVAPFLVLCLLAYAF